MANCKVCATEDNLVYSGVDALLLGIEGAETQKICYDCANQQAKVAGGCDCGNCNCRKEETNGDN